MGSEWAPSMGQAAAGGGGAVVSVGFSPRMEMHFPKLCFSSSGSLSDSG